MNTCQPSSQAIPVITKWAPYQNDHLGRDGGYTWAQRYRLSLTTAYLAITASKFPIRHLHQVTNMVPSHGLIDQLLNCRLNILNNFHHGRGSMVLLLEQTLTLAMCLTSLHKCFCPNICGLRESLIHHHVVTQSVASDQGTHFTTNEVTTMGICSWSFNIPHHPKVASLTDW